MEAKKGNLSIDSENIFPIIKKWVYSDHDIFVRELISNGCDAITKLKKLDMMGEYELPEGYKPKIEVIVNPEEKTMKFIDNGLGMTADLGIDEVHAELLPADKVSEVEEILKKNTGKGKLAFVGDGINDAPVLSRADIGIAMGAMGSDAAIEAADIVLMDDDPLKISKAIRISRKCLRIVYENIWFAIGIKLICLILGAVGIANMWLAIFADVGVMIIAVLNAIRALFVKKL